MALQRARVKGTAKENITAPSLVQTTTVAKSDTTYVEF